MVENAFPSQNPVNNDTLIGAFKQAFKKFLQGQVDDMLPCQVISVTSDRKYVSVQPMILVVTTRDETVVRAPAAKIPVYTPGGGGFVISCPIKATDFGWLKANDRDISLFLQSMKNSSPNTARMHSFSDAIFLPQILADYVIDSDDTDSMIISSLNGTVRVALSSNKITLTAPNIEIDSNLLINGDLNVTGTTVGNGINLNTHVHGGVQTGSGDTGVPT